MIDSKIRHVTLPGFAFTLKGGNPDMLWVNGQDLLLVNKTAAEFIETFIEVMSRHSQDLDSNPF